MPTGSPASGVGRGPARDGWTRDRPSADGWPPRWSERDVGQFGAVSRSGRSTGLDSPIRRAQHERVINRRDFALTVGLTAGLGLAVGSVANSAKALAAPPASHTSLGALKQVDAGVLNVGYAEAGPPDGPPVILLHGWPYDIHSYVDVAPVLAARGYRVLVPYLRGYGTTTFTSADAVRNGQQAALAQDAVDFMD